MARILRKAHNTVVAQVHSVIAEHFSDAVAFTQDDVKSHLAWVEDGNTNRINAALHYLAKFGAIICVISGVRGRAGSCAVFMADADTLKEFEPKMLNVKLGYTKNRKKRREKVT